jgi:hypothetical protein
MPEGSAVMNDRKVEWKPGDIKWPSTGKELDEENEFVAAGATFTDTPPERWSDTEYDNWASELQSGQVTKVEDGKVFIQLDAAFRGRWYVVAYPEGKVATDPALDDISKVWEEWVEDFAASQPKADDTTTGTSIPDVTINSAGQITLVDTEPTGGPSDNGQHEG